MGFGAQGCGPCGCQYLGGEWVPVLHVAHDLAVGGLHRHEGFGRGAAVPGAAQNVCHRLVGVAGRAFDLGDFPVRLHDANVLEQIDRLAFGLEQMLGDVPRSSRLEPEATGEGVSVQQVFHPSLAPWRGKFAVGDEVGCVHAKCLVHVVDLQRRHHHLAFTVGTDDQKEGPLQWLEGGVREVEDIFGGRDHVVIESAAVNGLNQGVVAPGQLGGFGGIVDGLHGWKKGMDRWLDRWKGNHPSGEQSAQHRHHPEEVDGHG